MDVRQKAILRFYNFFSDSNLDSVLDVPLSHLIKIQSYSLKELCKPFAFEDAIRGHSRDKLSITYGITVEEGRGIRKLAK